MYGVGGEYQRDMMGKKGATFQATIYRVETKRDGSGRLTLDFGADAIDEIHWAEKVHLKRGFVFEVALVPLPPEVINEEPDFKDLDMGEDL